MIDLQEYYPLLSAIGMTSNDHYVRLAISESLKLQSFQLEEISESYLHFYWSVQDGLYDKHINKINKIYKMYKQNKRFLWHWGYRYLSNEVIDLYRHILPLFFCYYKQCEYLIENETKEGV